MTDLLGKTCALGTALTWGCAVVLFKRSGERISPLALNLFKNTIAVVLLTLTLPLPFLGEQFSDVVTFDWADIAILMISGVIGIALADTIFFRALNLIGVGLTSIVDCTYSPLIIFFSWWWLSEKLTWAHGIGAVLVIGGMLVASRVEPPADRTRRQIIGGVLLGVLAITLMAIGIVMAKPSLERVSLVWGTLLRLVAGSAVLATMGLASPQRRSLFSVYRPSRVWWFSVPGSILGAYLAMILWIGGFKYTNASIAAVLNQTSVVFSILLATIFLHERLTLRKLIAVTMALSGAFLVAWNPF